MVDVKEKKPDFVFVAMGFPIQELLMYELYRIHTATYLNLGGSFDVFTNKVSRAPRWIQNIGMEWFYRFITHPSRYKRQVVYWQFLCAYYGGASIIEEINKLLRVEALDYIINIHENNCGIK